MNITVGIPGLGGNSGSSSPQSGFGLTIGLGQPLASSGTSGLNNNGSGSSMSRDKISHLIDDVMRNNPNMSQGVKQALGNFKDAVNKGSGNQSGGYGLSGNNSQNNALAESLRQAADIADGGHSAKNSGGQSGGSPLDQLKNLLQGNGMGGNNQNQNMSQADQKGIQELIKGLMQAMGGQNGADSLQNNSSCDDESNGDKLGLGGNDQSGQGGDISPQELGKDIQQLGKDLASAGNDPSKSDSSGNGGVSFKFQNAKETVSVNF